MIRSLTRQHIYYQMTPRIALILFTSSLNTKFQAKHGPILKSHKLNKSRVPLQGLVPRYHSSTTRKLLMIWQLMYSNGMRLVTYDTSSTSHCLQLYALDYSADFASSLLCLATSASLITEIRRGKSELEYYYKRIQARISAKSPM